MDNTQMRRFQLVRHDDISGLSGTGVVVEGVEFSDGTCAIAWRTHIHTYAIYPNIKTVEYLHGHDGATEVVWID